MKQGFEPGQLTIKYDATVTEEMLSRLDGELVFPVISTSGIAAMMEAAGRRMVSPYLEQGQEALGVELSVEHLATCGSGKQLTVTAELVEFRHQKARLNLAVFDGERLIATGVHTHHIVPTATLDAAIAAGQAR